MELMPNILLPRMQELFVSSARLLYDKKKGVPLSSIERRDELLNEMRAFLEFGESLKGKDWEVFKALKPLLVCFFECFSAKIFEGDWDASTLSGKLPEVTNPREYFSGFLVDGGGVKDWKKKLKTPEFKVFLAEAVTLDQEARLRIFEDGKVESILTESTTMTAQVDVQTGTHSVPGSETKVIDRRPLTKTKKFWVTLALAIGAALAFAVGGRSFVQDYYQNRMTERQDEILAEEFSSLGSTNSNEDDEVSHQQAGGVTQ